MKPLTVNGTHYTINHTKQFVGKSIDRQCLNDAFAFAYEMVFGKGYHRTHRTGGSHQRKKGELFCNTFQGKIAEKILYDYLINNDIVCQPIDYSIAGQGIWDDADLIANSKKINIKSGAFFSNLLLLETKDWDDHANYIPNALLANTTAYDYFVFIRIKPNLKEIFTKHQLFYTDDIDRKTLVDVFKNIIITYDIAGYCKLADLQIAITTQQILPKDAMLNGKIKMDADNYYIQSGDLMDVKMLAIALKINE